MSIRSDIIDHIRGHGPQTRADMASHITCENDRALSNALFQMSADNCKQLVKTRPEGGQPIYDLGPNAGNVTDTEGEPLTEPTTPARKRPAKPAKRNPGPKPGSIRRSPGYKDIADKVARLPKKPPVPPPALAQLLRTHEQRLADEVLRAIGLLQGVAPDFDALVGLWKSARTMATLAESA